jgi:hypothetical protein
MTVTITTEGRVQPTIPDAPKHAPVRLSPARACAVPLAFSLGLLAFCLMARVHDNPRLLWSFVGAVAVLLVWDGILFLRAQRHPRAFIFEFVPRKQHWMQACAHASILVYWGWHWRQVYDSAFLIAAQLAFAYAIDSLLSWSRRDTYTFGFGPFPIIFSTNLFLWFRQDWFYFQFLMVAVGFLAKELIRWEKDGRQVHIFNPSSFTLTIFSLGLILTNASDISWGKEIAITQFYPPHMYLFLFLVGLPGQFLFGVTTMTMSAVLTTYLIGVAYFAFTGTYYFFDSYIPIAVFLGMHLLFTDPSTAPRTELGRLIFGALYGLSTVFLYELLGVLGLPTFYDKLLQVPLLNLLIQLIDRAVRSPALRRFDPGNLGRALAARRRNLAYMSIWVTAFLVMSAVQGVGDEHPGQWLPFWRHACGENRPYACLYLAQLQTNYCRAGSGWSCNELGLQQIAEGDPAGAAASLTRGCELGFEQACNNIKASRGGATPSPAPPGLNDFPIILRGSKGPIDDEPPAALLARACEQGWPGTCGRADMSGRR